jgi:prephenate dehydrogenase
MLINKLAIIGVGLIGGSLARALRRAGVCNHISGYGRDETNMQRAIELGVIDEYSHDITRVVADADVVVLATPLATMEPLLGALLPSLQTKTIITDVGSAKGSVVQAARNALGDRLRQFVPGHPIAGTEQSGVEASFADLFVDHMIILTPLPENETTAVETISRMWESCGATVVSLSVDHHDQVLAATSHLPHVLAYALVDCLAGMNEHDEIFRFSAGGFRDFTRIASSNPEMWSDICIANGDKLLKMISQFESHLAGIKAMISTNDRDNLREVFARVKHTRDTMLAERQSLLSRKKPD